jgi:hypothetical protein
VRLEGALLLPDLLEKAAQGQASCQQPEDYHVPRGFTLQDERSTARSGGCCKRVTGCAPP